MHTSMHALLVCLRYNSYNLAPASRSASRLASHAIRPKKLKILLSALASALLACPSAARAEMPWAIMASRKRIHDRTHLHRCQYMALLVEDRRVMYPMPCIGQFQGLVTISVRLECHLAASFMPSTHHCSISSRCGSPVSALLRPFSPTIKLLAPPGFAPEGPACFDGPATASRSFGEIGAKENGKRRLPRSANGEPRVHSSQSSIPITRGSVGWNICHMISSTLLSQ